MPFRREIAMARLYFASRSGWLVFSAATAAGAVAGALLSAVVLLFQSRGEPMGEWAVAERACAQHAYRSERDTCMKQWLATSRATSVASK
jgi:hypothetical protein